MIFIAVKFEMSTVARVSSLSSGNLEADYWVGMMYQLGAGVAKSSATAVNWYRKAALRDYTGALHQVRAVECARGGRIARPTAEESARGFRITRE